MRYVWFVSHKRIGKDHQFMIYTLILLRQCICMHTVGAINDHVVAS